MSPDPVVKKSMRTLLASHNVQQRLVLVQEKALQLVSHDEGQTPCSGTFPGTQEACQAWLLFEDTGGPDGCGPFTILIARTRAAPYFGPLIPIETDQASHERPPAADVVLHVVLCVLGGASPLFKKRARPLTIEDLQVFEMVRAAATPQTSQYDDGHP